MLHSALLEALEKQADNVLEAVNEVETISTKTFEEANKLHERRDKDEKGSII
jgi:hypothetical protein